MARGGLGAVAAGGAAIVVGGVLAVVLLVRSCSGEAPPPPSRSLAGANASAGADGMRAPGTAALRQLGCDQAIVVDMARLLGEGGRVRDDEPRFMVTCDISANADAPSCERTAAVYLTAIGGTAEGAVGVRILRGGASAPVCSHLYAPNGADLGVFPRAP